MKKEQPKILIIEDNIYNHALYRDIFERYGFEVVLRKNADGFLTEEVHELKPDIISMDLMIGNEGPEEPERDGFEAIAALKGDIRTHTIPIIVMTSFSEEGRVRRAKDLGVVDYINLPAHTMTKLPEHFLEYLSDPQHYKPSHSLFK